MEKCHNSPSKRGGTGAAGNQFDLEEVWRGDTAPYSIVAPTSGESPELIREELFSSDRLKNHARSLAAVQPVSSRKQGGRELFHRLRADAEVLESYRSIAQAVEHGNIITPAAEWILDNYHIVEEQIFDIRGDLPPGYYRELPKLTAGPFAVLPRVFGMMWAYVAHTDSR